MVDNFDLIRDFLDYDEENFYFVQIIKRRKENPEMKKGTSLKRTYTITKKEDFDKIKDSVINTCKFYNARAYIHLNKRSHKKVALQMLKVLADNIYNENYCSSKRIYDHACGVVCSDKNKKWIIDIDSKNEDELKKLEDHLKEIEVNIMLRIPTLNGYHYVVNPFNKSKFSLEHDIHKDNGTLLFF